MSIAEKLTTIANNMQLVKDAGKAQANDEFWDAFQEKGARNQYPYAFNNWGYEYIRPKYKVVPTTSHYSQMFYRNKNLKKVEAEYFDVSQIQMTDSQKTQSTYGNYYTFQFCYRLEEIEDIGLNDVGYSGTFHGCESLHTIAMLRSNENTTFGSTPFNGCTSLVNIKFSDDSVIGKNLDIHSSPLNKASIENIIGCLSETASGKTLSLKQSAVEAAFSNDEWIELITPISNQYNGNWTISLS